MRGCLARNEDCFFESGQTHLDGNSIWLFTRVVTCYAQNDLGYLPSCLAAVRDYALYDCREQIRALVRHTGSVSCFAYILIWIICLIDGRPED